MKRAVLALLILVLLCCGCTKKQEASTPTGNQIRSEIANAYDMDDTDKQMVADLFADMDKAFEKLANSKRDASDLFVYASKVSQLIKNFDASFDWDAVKRKVDNATDNEEKLKWIECMSDRAQSLTAPAYNLSFELVKEDSSGEHCAELAVNAVNAYSQYFYGEVHITDNDLDRIS